MKMAARRVNEAFVRLPEVPSVALPRVVRISKELTLRADEERMESERSRDWFSFIAAAGFGAFVGFLIGLGLTSLDNRVSCPKCMAKIPAGVDPCPNCKTALIWRSLVK